jgi:DNA-binding NtrC family response regulator
VGLVAAADSGTLFLDEVGDLPPSQQAKLLTAVEERRIRPVGASLTLEVDFRLLSASCLPLSELRARGRFRDDLYHRIALLAVTLPPLRERVTDILPLARRFLGGAVRRHGLGERILDPGVRKVLENHAWPGNVRQLAHVVEAAAILADDARIGADLVGPLLDEGAGTREVP